MTIATSTIEASVVPVVIAFGRAAAIAATDATAAYRVVSGISDGNDYGRYTAGENPLLSYAAFATSVDAMIARGAALRALVDQAIATAKADASGNLGALWIDLLNLTGSVRRACANPADAIRILASLAAFEAVAPPSVFGDPIGAQIETLYGATARLARRAATISLAVASADYAPTSQQYAAALRDRLADIFETAIDEAADNFDDASYTTLARMRAAVIDDLTARGASLAPISARTFGANQPALVVAYRLYQDAARADDLLARNDCPHPAFLPVTLEVLAS